MAKMGAPLKEIDKNNFEDLCAIFCTLVDISGWFKVSEDTIERWCKRTYKATFAECFKKYAFKGRVSLRRKQYQMAMDGNITMLIWLGKQHLGQCDSLRDLKDVEDPRVFIGEKIDVLKLVKNV